MRMTFLLTLIFIFPGLLIPSPAEISVGNRFVAITFDVSGGRLHVDSLVNRIISERLMAQFSDGFALHLGNAEPLGDRQALSLQDFRLIGEQGRTDHSIVFELEDSQRGLRCLWHWEAAEEGPYVRTWIEVKNIGSHSLAIADVDVLVLRFGNVPGPMGLELEADSEEGVFNQRQSMWAAVDGDPATAWVAKQGGSLPGESPAPKPHWIHLRLPKPAEIGSVVVRSAPELELRDLDIEVHMPGGDWARAGGAHENPTADARIQFAKPVTATDVRVIVTKVKHGGVEEDRYVGISELELYDGTNRRIPLLSANGIPVQRSTAIGNGEGVALVAARSVFAALEALLYDYRLGVSQDGQGFRMGHNPGWKLEPGAAATSKKAVLGVAPRGQAGPWFVTKYLKPNWRQMRQGNRQWDRFWCYNSTEDNTWSLRTPEIATLAKALGVARQKYGFWFRYVGPDETAFVDYDPFRLGLNKLLFPDGFDKPAEAIEASGSSVEGYYGIGRLEDIATPAAKQHYRKTLSDLIDRYRVKMLICDRYVGGHGGYNVYLREQVWDNFRETVNLLQARHPDLFIGLESFSPNTLTRWVWVNSQFDHNPNHYLKYSPDAGLNNPNFELIPDAGNGSAPMLHSRDGVNASAGVYDLYGVPWRGVETFGPLWQMIYDPFSNAPAGMERVRDTWVMNLFGSATVISPVTYGRILDQPPEDLAWLGKMLRIRDDNIQVLKECVPKENGDIFHCTRDRGFAVLRHLRWEEQGENSFRLNHEIGLTEAGANYVVKQIYPTERVLTDTNGNWIWKYGERIRVVLNPFEIRLISIEPAVRSGTAAVGCSYETDSEGHVTMLGLPGEECQVQRVMHGRAEGRSERMAFAGTPNTGSWYKKIAQLSPISKAEVNDRQAELLRRLDFVKATGYPAEWRASNVYGLLEYLKLHKYPQPEIEAARDINLAPVRTSLKWLCDDSLETPPSRSSWSGLVHFPLLIGQGALQVDLGQLRDVARIRIAVLEDVPRLTVGVSADGRRWTEVNLTKDGRFWHWGDRRPVAGRYLRIESSRLTAQEFQVWANQEVTGQLERLDWSDMHPYPISVVRSLTQRENLNYVWKARFQLPRTYDGQQIAIPIWLEQESRVSDLWPLYRVDGEERSNYHVVPGYAKDRDHPFILSTVKGLTFKLPINSGDAGKDVEIVVTSRNPIKHSEAWLVSDPLPYERKLLR